jgi:hypothetical protein
MQVIREDINASGIPQALSGLSAGAAQREYYGGGRGQIARRPQDMLDLKA